MPTKIILISIKFRRFKLVTASAKRCHGLISTMFVPGIQGQLKKPFNSSGVQSIFAPEALTTCAIRT
jgi:hypothetical protein